MFNISEDGKKELRQNCLSMTHELLSDAFVNLSIRYIKTCEECDKLTCELEKYQNESGELEKLISSLDDD